MYNLIAWAWRDDPGGHFCPSCDAPKGRGHYDGCESEHAALMRDCAAARADVERLRILVSEVRVYGHSGTKHGATANVPEDWDDRARAALAEKGSKWTPTTPYPCATPRFWSTSRTTSGPTPRTYRARSEWMGWKP